jgi:hypothetical protein
MDLRRAMRLAFSTEPTIFLAPSKNEPRMSDNVVHFSACEACRQRQPLEIVAHDDPGEPYRVCGACSRRLRQLALRPLEWFNLSAKHGWQKFLLHDDFYDQDGTACQPEIEIYSVDGMAAPTLTQASGSIDRLVDYCITRWSLDQLEFDHFRTFADETTLDELKQRAATGNRHVLGVALVLCANVLQHSAAAWVRAMHSRACDDDVLFSWAEAAARCLPQPEGLRMTFDALRAHSEPEMRKRKGALSWFRSPAVLDWIEVRAPNANVTEDWGRLAALSGLSWRRVDDWLSRGRPLSLIGLDALLQFVPRNGHAPLLKKLAPKLKGCPDHSVMAQALRAYMTVDPAPRVSDRCNYLLDQIEMLQTE